MNFSAKRVVVAVLLGSYFYVLMPATATLFYELYHLTDVGAIYWGYSLFKAAGYYFGTWEYQLHACVLIVLVVLFLPGTVHWIRSGRKIS